MRIREADHPRPLGESACILTTTVQHYQQRNAAVVRQACRDIKMVIAFATREGPTTVPSQWRSESPGDPADAKQGPRLPANPQPRACCPDPAVQSIPAPARSAPKQRGSLMAAPCENLCTENSGGLLGGCSGLGSRLGGKTAQGALHLGRGGCELLGAGSQLLTEMGIELSLPGDQLRGSLCRQRGLGVGNSRLQIIAGNGVLEAGKA